MFAKVRADLRAYPQGPIVWKQGEVVEITGFTGVRDCLAIVNDNGLWATECFIPCPDPIFYPQQGMTIYHPNHPHLKYKVVFKDDYWMVLQRNSSMPRSYSALSTSWKDWKEVK